MKFNRKRDRRTVAAATITVSVRARPHGIWTPAKTLYRGSVWLEISVPGDQAWSYADAETARCGADGDPTALLSPARCLVATAPVGALIGKIGGSSAGIASDGPAFVVGRYCVVQVPEKGGSLYLTINDESAGFENNAGSIEVEIREIVPIGTT
jgi:hypothetical protein